LSAYAISEIRLARDVEVRFREVISVVLGAATAESFDARVEVLPTVG